MQLQKKSLILLITKLLRNCLNVLLQIIFFIKNSAVFHGANQRQDCIRELLDTERAYVDDLAIVCRIFEQPLKKNKIISNKDISQIFLNWEEILKCNEDFLKDLSGRMDKGSDVIGDIILLHVSNHSLFFF